MIVDVALDLLAKQGRSGAPSAVESAA